MIPKKKTCPLKAAELPTIRVWLARNRCGDQGTHLFTDEPEEVNRAVWVSRMGAAPFAKSVGGLKSGECRRALLVVLPKEKA